MWRVVLGVVLIAIGVSCFSVGLQYASFAVPLGAGDPLRDRYQTLSAAFGYSSYAVALAGAALIIWGLRCRSKSGKGDK